MTQGSDNKDMVKLLAEVDDAAGWRVDRGRRGWKVYPPEGEPRTVTTGPRNPWRQRKNFIAWLRRHGYDI